MKKYLLLLLLLTLNAWSLEIPTLSRPVHDPAGTLSSSEVEELETTLRAIHNEGFLQIAVLIIPSLEEENLEEYSIKVAETWKLGDKEKDNGVLILLAMAEKKIRIEVGNGVEGELTDYLSKQIIESMVPYMRSSQYQEALSFAATTLNEKMKANTPEMKAIREEEEKAAAILNAKNDAIRKQTVMTGLSVIVILGGLGLLVGCFTKKKLIALNKDLSETGTKIAETSASLKTKEAELKNIKLDPLKYELAQVRDRVRLLTSTKENLTKKISEMKTYLGVN